MNIEKKTFTFLQKLAKNNNRNWFLENKTEYLLAKENVKDFFQAVQSEIDKTDQIDKFKIYRIYRDIRFSKDKTPYKEWMSGYLSRFGPERRGGYYIHIEPGDKTIIGGGFYAPEKDDLYRIRKEFEADPNEIQNVYNHLGFKKTYGKLIGNSLKTRPKGFPKEHPAIELIRMKQYYAICSFTDEEVLNKDFFLKTVNALKNLRPFFDYFSEILTTNLDGESIIS